MGFGFGVVLFRDKVLDKLDSRFVFYYRRTVFFYRFALRINWEMDEGVYRVVGVWLF